MEYIYWLSTVCQMSAGLIRFKKPTDSPQQQI